METTVDIGGLPDEQARLVREIVSLDPFKAGMKLRKSVCRTISSSSTRKMFVKALAHGAIRQGAVSDRPLGDHFANSIFLTCINAPACNR